MDKDIINYSQCWEDPDILTKALKISADDIVLSVTSGGDNAIALLLCNPQKITSIDLNYAQNYLLELKLTAAKVLTYDEYLSFLGITDSSNRGDSFSKVKQYLTPEASLFWSNHYTAIETGVINSGRFEKFLNSFRKYLLPLVHSSKTITQFVTVSSLKQQREFYKNRWNTKRWRMYFRLATSRSILKYFARQRGMFKYTKMKMVSDEYLKRLKSNLSNIPLTNNYFLHYCLTGGFGKTLPAYLQKKNYALLKKNKTSKLSIVSSNTLTYLKSVPDNSYTKYNLSDIFEALSDNETNMLWEEIIRTSKKDAVIVYWDNLLSNPVPARFSNIVKSEKQLERKLSSKDRVFFYGDFHIYKIIK